MCALFGQSPGIQRTIVIRADVSPPGREAIVARVELPAGATSGRHTHPGEEISYVIEGEIEVTLDGLAPCTRKAGEAFIIPAGAVHNARAIGSHPVVLSGVYVIEKGKPLATPVQ